MEKVMTWYTLHNNWLTYYKTSSSVRCNVCNFLKFCLEPGRKLLKNNTISLAEAFCDLSVYPIIIHGRPSTVFIISFEQILVYSAVKYLLETQRLQKLLQSSCCWLATGIFLLGALQIFTCWKRRNKKSVKYVQS